MGANIAVDVRVTMNQAAQFDDPARKTAPAAASNLGNRLSQIVDRIAQIGQRTGVAADTQDKNTTLPQSGTVLTTDSLQQWVDGALSQGAQVDNQSLQKYVDSALNKDAEVSASGLQRWVDSALNKDAEVSASGLQRWVDSAFSDIKLDVTPFRQSIEAAAEEVTRAPVQEINEHVDRLMQDTKDLVQWQQNYSATEKQTQETINKSDTMHSARYIITAVRHIINTSMNYESVVELSKDSYSSNLPSTAKTK